MTPTTSSSDLVLRTDTVQLVATLSLNRPDKLNAIDAPTLRRLVERLTECEHDPDIRVIVIRGEGRSFSVGADASGAGGSTTLSAEDWRVQLLESGWGQFLRFWESPKPVIVQVHGHCLGIALLLCNCSDIVFVADDSRIGWPALPLGGGILGPSMVWHMGIHRSKEMSYQIGAEMSGQEAVTYGFANRAVPASDLGDEVQRLARNIARFPSDLLRLKKEAINRVAESQGFTASMRLGAAWGALAHHSSGADAARTLVRDLGLLGAIDQYREESE